MTDRDRNPDDLPLDAWSVAPLSPDFEDRVLAALDRNAHAELAPVPSMTPPPRASRGSRRAALGLAVAAGVVLTLLIVKPQPEPSLDEAGVLALADDARIHLGEDADVRWRRDDAGRFVVDHRHGSARYEVEPGTPLEVKTPAGSVTVTGTVFDVEVMTMNEATRTKQILAATGAVGVFVAAVAVLEGRVEVHNAHGSISVTKGRSAVMTDAEPPRDPDATQLARTPSLDPEPTLDPRADRRIDATRHARMREQIRRAVEASAERPPTPTDDDDSPRGVLDKEYIREVVSDDLVPLARECYNDALERLPDLRGRMVLEFTIMGDPSVGGIVDAVDLADDTEIGDPEMRECVRESLMSVSFPPPNGGGIVSVTYPLIFTPPD